MIARRPRAPVAMVRPGVIRKFTARGRVVDERGRGIYQAALTLQVSAGRRRVTTGRDGSFTFPTIDQGRYPVRVAKTGFATVNGSITVPQTAPQTIRMRQVAACELLVRLMRQVDGGQQPFVGIAKVLIQTPQGRRLESMDGRSEASFSLPPGKATITVTSPEAERISPPSASVNLRAGSGTRPTLLFTISPASTLVNADVQLLGFVCRRVPRCPNPENVGGSG